MCVCARVECGRGGGRLVNEREKRFMGGFGYSWRRKTNFVIVYFWSAEHNAAECTFDRRQCLTLTTTSEMGSRHGRCPRSGRGSLRAWRRALQERGEVYDNAFVPASEA